MQDDGYYTTFAAPLDINPGMVVRVSEVANAALPACADRLENCRGVYGIVLKCGDTGGYYKSGPAATDYTTLGVSVCGQGFMSLTAEAWAAVIDTPGRSLVPGELLYLSDRHPGHLSTSPGNFIVPIGIAMSPTQLKLGIGTPSLRLHRRIVESAWLREDRRAFALVFADREQQVWEVMGAEDCRIEDIFQKQSGDLPIGAIRGPFGDLIQGEFRIVNPPLTHEIMRIDDMNVTLALTGADAFLGARAVADRAMREDEKWTEV